MIPEGMDKVGTLPLFSRLGDGSIKGRMYRRSYRRILEGVNVLVIKGQIIKGQMHPNY